MEGWKADVELVLLVEGFKCLQMGWGKRYVSQGILAWLVCPQTPLNSILRNRLAWKRVVFKIIFQGRCRDRSVVCEAIKKAIQVGSEDHVRIGGRGFELYGRVSLERRHA